MIFVRSLPDTPMTSPSPPTISFDDSGFVDGGGAASKPLLPKLTYAWDEMNTGLGGGNGRYSSPYMFLTRYIIDNIVKSIRRLCARHFLFNLSI